MSLYIDETYRKVAEKWVEEHCYSLSNCPLPSKDCLARLLTEAWANGFKEGLDGLGMTVIRAISPACDAGDCQLCRSGHCGCECHEN